MPHALRITLFFTPQTIGLSAGGTRRQMVDRRMWVEGTCPNRWLKKEKRQEYKTQGKQKCELCMLNAFKPCSPFQTKKQPGKNNDIGNEDENHVKSQNCETYEKTFTCFIDMSVLCSQLGHSHVITVRVGNYNGLEKCNLLSKMGKMPTSTVARIATASTILTRMKGVRVVVCLWKITDGNSGQRSLPTGFQIPCPARQMKNSWVKQASKAME